MATFIAQLFLNGRAEKAARTMPRWLRFVKSERSASQ
jgi:hypothetical protein